MILGSDGEDGSRSQSDDGLEHPQKAEIGDSSIPGISFACHAEIYHGTGNSTSSKPAQVLKIDGRLVVKVSISQFSFSVKHRLKTNGDDSWSI